MKIKLTIYFILASVFALMSGLFIYSNITRMIDLAKLQKSGVKIKIEVLNNGVTDTDRINYCFYTNPNYKENSLQPPLENVDIDDYLKEYNKKNGLVYGSDRVSSKMYQEIYTKKSMQYARYLKDNPSISAVEPINDQKIWGVWLHSKGAFMSIPMFLYFTMILFFLIQGQIQNKKANKKNTE